MSAATRFVLQLNIDLPDTPATLSALTHLLNAVADVPGAVLSTQDELSRLTAPLPRPRHATPDVLNDRLHIDATSRTVRRHGILVNLTRLEFDLLLYLSARPNQVHQRNTLLARVWGNTTPFHTRTVDVHIRRLRDKLGPYATLITTVRGVGYRFDGSPRVVLEPSGG